jgi:hypothetical protein
MFFSFPQKQNAQGKKKNDVVWMELLARTHTLMLDTSVL